MADMAQGDRCNAKAGRVVAAIVTYNKKDQVLNLLERLKTISIPAVVTANSCSDGTEEAIKNGFPGARLIESHVNLGGTGGFNCSLMAALETGCEYVVFLDDDALPEPDCIEKLVSFLDNNPDYSFAAPAIYISSRPDTLQETGGSVDFKGALPLFAYNRFEKNADLPEVIDIDYASACCLIARSADLRKIGLLDWNYFIFSDDVDLCLRLGRFCGKGACVTTAAAFHDFPWAKPFSPARLYYYHRNNLYFVSKMGNGRGRYYSLFISLARLFRDIPTSFIQGDREHCRILFSALSDAMKGKYGPWTDQVSFPDSRKTLSGEWFIEKKVKNILVDLSEDGLSSQIIEKLMFLSGKDVRIDLYSEQDSDENMRGCTRKIKRKPGRLSFLRAFSEFLFSGYDLVITDASMSVRRITSFPGRFSAFFHNGDFFLSETKTPFPALLAFFFAPFIGILGASLGIWRFVERPLPGKTPDNALEVFSRNGLGKRIADAACDLGKINSELKIRRILEKGVNSPCPCMNNFLYDRIMGRLQPFFKRAIRSLPFLKDGFLFRWSRMPGPGEAEAGFGEWCRMREKIAPFIYADRAESVSGLLFSILVPVCDPEPGWLRSCVESVIAQHYAGWELILVDDASRNPKIHSILKKYQGSDKRISVFLNDRRSGISASTNRAAEHAKGDYVFFLDHDDILDRFCLSAFAERIRASLESGNGPVSLIYADEDRFDDTMRRSQPGFKPAYSPDLLLGTNYLHHPVAVRTDLYRRAGGLKSEYDGSQDHDFLLRVLEIEDNVVHIPDILYHMRIHPGSLSSGPAAKPKAHVLDRIIIREALSRRGVEAEIEEVECGFPGYSRIIRKISERPDVSVIISGRCSGHERWSGASEILFASEDKNRSSAFNELAQTAKSEILVFADSSAVPSHLWLDVILPHLLRDDVAVVTGKMIFADGRLFSCGISLGMNDGSGFPAGSWHQGLDSSTPGYGGWMSLDHEIQAASFRFMAVRRSLFISNGGFDEAFITSGFDMDFCLRVSEKGGLRHLCLPACVVTLNCEKALTDNDYNDNDARILENRWLKKHACGDPFVNPNYSRIGTSVKIAGFAEMAARKIKFSQVC